MANDLTLYDRADWWDPQDGFHLLNKMNPGRFRFFDRVVDSWKDLAVVDVGCGGGFTCEFLAKRGARVTGVDLSEPSLEQARKHAAQSGVQVTYRRASALELPFADASMDVVVCVDVLEHIPQWADALQEFHRVLKPGGVFLFDTINRNFFAGFVMVTLLEKTLGLIPRGTHDPRLFIKPKELLAVLKNTGFRQTEMAGLGVFWSPAARDFFAYTGGPLGVLYIGHAKKQPPG